MLGITSHEGPTQLVKGRLTDANQQSVVSGKLGSAAVMFKTGIGATCWADGYRRQFQGYYTSQSGSRA